ncbi:hypothetical protein [Chryseobacterium indologenes]|uniref:Uncharacterized protein n=1 Tax=Chryseobacterium indologenes TaxID=253 RepID=A0A0N0IXJ3_CHRID|nr:hypothetical protein [Chryseobacterium indologenes]KPE52331.1 hypothetical protein AOB46_05520 [Chryseobacterium indologenes]
MDNRQNSEDTVPFGLAIANRVADQLLNGHILGYCHRDYCGMGMKADGNQRFFYGEIYDCDFDAPRVFENRDLFVSWLSVQSTASLARMGDEDFYAGNQVISRKRILEFIQ